MKAVIGTCMFDQLIRALHRISNIASIRGDENWNNVIKSHGFIQINVSTWRCLGRKIVGRWPCKCDA